MRPRFSVGMPCEPVPAAWRLATVALVALAAASGASGCSERQEAAFRIPGADPEHGRRLIEQVGCGACHVIPGVSNADGMVGPPLTNFGSRAYVAGQLPNTPDQLVLWLLDPPSFDSATAMPAVGFTANQARDVAAYLYTLGDARPLGPPHLLPKSWLERL